MKVAELIEVLKSCPQDAEVVAQWDGGWSTLKEHELRKDNRGLTIVEFDVSEFGTHVDW